MKHLKKFNESVSEDDQYKELGEFLQSTVFDEHDIYYTEGTDALGPGVDGMGSYGWWKYSKLAGGNYGCIVIRDMNRDVISKQIESMRSRILDLYGISFLIINTGTSFINIHILNWLDPIPESHQHTHHHQCKSNDDQYKELGEFLQNTVFDEHDVYYDDSDVTNDLSWRYSRMLVKLKSGVLSCIRNIVVKNADKSLAAEINSMKKRVKEMYGIEYEVAFNKQVLYDLGGKAKYTFWIEII